MNLRKMIKFAANNLAKQRLQRAIKISIVEFIFKNNSEHIFFSVQYRSVESTSALEGANRVIAGRSRHTISLQLDWHRVERRARECGTTALAAVTVLTGAEFTRRRILK